MACIGLSPLFTRSAKRIQAKNKALSYLGGRWRLAAEDYVIARGNASFFSPSAASPLCEALTLSEQSRQTRVITGLSRASLR